MKLNRRHFIQKASVLTLGFMGLSRQAAKAQDHSNQVDLYGDLVPDPDGIMDLPRGFSYQILSRTGDFMSDNLRIPGAPDGMAAFSLRSDRAVLVRNHELSPGNSMNSPYGVRNELEYLVDRSLMYDAREEGAPPHIGGTTNLVYNFQTRQVERQFLSLAGTARNCAGGPTPWRTWITCEETVDKAGNGNLKDHGYNFEVPASARRRLYDPIPLKAMGRFNHEAVAVHPETSVVYQTEDCHDGLIYRYVPVTPGKLANGGRLEALVIQGQPARDTRNWDGDKLEKLPAGQKFKVEWIPLTNVESPEDDLRYRGAESGAAVFARGEGMWYGNGEVYFACTNGGANMSGQIFRYIPSPYEATPREKEFPATLELFIEPNDKSLVEFCDNLTITPWGDLILAEDGPEEQFLRMVTPEGKTYTLARNAMNGSEFTGPCMAPNHPTLFVNIQNPGLTLAITGPWSTR